MTEETKRTLIITIGIFLSVITGTYIYSQNTGYYACYNNAIKIQKEILDDEWLAWKSVKEPEAHRGCEDN